MNSLRYLGLLLSFSLSALVLGQQISITSGSATSCSGVIEDSGGPNAEYSDNENITFTICPDVPGNVIYLTWFVFNLSGQQPNADNLTIYDGDNTGELSLGTYGGSALQNLIVSGTVFNTSGCLTLVFNSNGAGTGNFAAGFQCTVPCQNPTSVATMSEAIPGMICQGETVTFNGNGSSAQPTYMISQYLWDFDDGSVDSTSGPITSHTFMDDGEHVVQLYVTDDNDCRNLNLVDLQILVSTTPNFSQTDPSIQTCFGETVSLYGHAEPVTWTGIPDANFGDGIFLPDDVGLPFTSTLTFEQFDSGQLVTSTTNILEICVEMEHTYMGDLVLQVICPNGQTVILHQQGGGSTYLGSPNDTDSNENPIIGECWEYCWSPTATTGTWVANSNFGTNNTTPAGIPTAPSLNPGTYESVQPFSNLVGCPLNGDWTYQSTDLWGADNGFICSWSINFDPAIIPDVTQFTPSFGPDADSTLWTGGTVPNSMSANGDTIVFTATAPGVYPFNYQVTDNFGCTYDTTITVTVAEPFEVEAGPDGVICNDPLQLNASIVGSASNCVWTLEMNDSFGDGWNGASLTVTINGVPSNYTCNGTQTIQLIPVQPGNVITLSYASGTFDNESSYRLLDDLGNVVFVNGPNPTIGLAWTGTATCDAQQGMVWSWTPVEGLSDPAIANPTVVVTNATTYVVTAHVAGHPVCNASDSLTITLDPGVDPGLDSLVIVCATPPSFQLIDMLGGTPDPGGIWTDATSAVIAGSFDPMVDPAGIYTYTITSALGCIGTADLEIQILSADDPVCCGIVDAGPDSTICVLSYDLSASIGNTGVGVWTGPAGFSFANASNAETTVTAPGSGSAMFYWTEDDGVLCYLRDSVTITFTVPLAAIMTTTDAICFEACDGTAAIAMTGGNGAFTYTWSDGLAAATDVNATDICAGSYTVDVVDENDCATSVGFTIDQPVLLEIDGTSLVEPWCHGACDGTVSISDPEAVEYSFDGGASFSQGAELADACTGLYDLVIRNAAGCLGTMQILLPEPPAVVADFGHGPIPANVNAPTIFFHDFSLHAASWQWDIAGLGSSELQNPEFTFSNKEPGIYEVCLIAQDAHNCPDTVCNTVIIDDVLFTYIPNSFTPDGDGVNEAWGMTRNIPDVKNFELWVFDRWGEVVFGTTDPAIWWNGSFRNDGGEVLKQDVYPYRVVYTLISTGGVREHNGHVTLLK